VTRLSSRGVDKLDDTLRDHYEKSPADARAYCLVWTDSAEPVEVENAIQANGGVVQYRVETVPGLIAELPVGALDIIASNEHVVQIDADDEYIASW